MSDTPDGPLQGDIFLTHAQAAVLGFNAAGRLDTSPLHTALNDRYPVFVSDYRKRGHAGHLAPGSLWVWQESTPWIVGLVVQETPTGIARRRFVEAAMLMFVRSWQQEELRSLAIMRMGDQADWPQLRRIVEHFMTMLPLPVRVYDDFRAGVNAEASPPDAT